MSSVGVKRKLCTPSDDQKISKRGREVESKHGGGGRGREPGMGPREGSRGRSPGRGRGDQHPPRNAFREGGRGSRDLGRGRGRGERRGNGAIFGRGDGRGRGWSRGRGAAFGRGDGRGRRWSRGRGAAFERGGGRGGRGDRGGRDDFRRGDGRGRGFTAGYRARGDGGRGKKEVEAPPPESLYKYTRGPGNSTSKSMEDRKLRSKLSKTEAKFKQASRDAAAAELLLPAEAGFLEAEGMEETFKFTQDEIKASVDLNTAKEIFELMLPDLGPYALDYTRNGRFLVLGGRLGHLALLDALRMDVRMEVQLGETIRDVKALHNENFVAVAQKKYAYIYDSQGAEVHCLRNHTEPHRLEFLPYHFLLASIGRTGYLKYTDVSTGQTVIEMSSKLGACDCLRANRHNAILHAGHHNGVVTMWTPAMGSPIVSMLAHPAAISTLAVDRTGHYMVTSGMDKKSRVWDLRTYKELHSYSHQMAPADMDISDRGLLSLGFGCHVQVWKDAVGTKAKAPYMEHDLPSTSISRCRFRPLQDVLGLGHSEGFSSMVVPGAGEPNFDTFEANPFQNAKQRREAEVVSLLEKLPPETITLDPSFVGKVDKDPTANVEEVREMMQKADPLTQKEPKEKNKTRGRSKLANKLRKKQKNVVDAGAKKLREKLEAEKSREKKVQEQKTREEQAKTAPAALTRFFRK